ncbi:MAG TPA: hypothetical protein VJY62_09870 [Bacteroidia bacterium]|nr:hypothetical protein [Bacteroidia bacterium]
MKTKTFIATTCCFMAAYLNVSGQSWSLTGNAGTSAADNFIGTTDNTAFKIRTNDNVRIIVTGNGNIKIGAGTPASKLDVSGTITATGGNSDNWNSAFGWGNHASAGYITSETDPQVGVLALNRVPRWDGISLINGSLYDNGTRIGIGTATPLFLLHAQSSTELRTAYFYNTTSSASTTFGIYSGAFGTGSGDKRGGSFDASGGTGINTGIKGFASGGATNYGVYAEASGTGTNYAAYFPNGNVYASDLVGIGITNPSYPLHVSNSTASRSGYFTNTFNSASTTYGVYANTTSAGAGSGYGVYGSVTGAGGINYGIRGFATGGSGNYGVYGFADGGSATTPAYGVYGTASGSENYWAGYFNGTTYSATLRIGTTDAASGYIVSVGGKIICEEVKVELEANWPDYVFNDNYKLKSLDELEKSIKENKHLPGMPSAKDISAQKGFHVGEMQSKLLEKIEEQALYILQLKKEIDEIKTAMVKSNNE